ncbi:glucose-6-phosphate dehydrogenase assembly protein OpcA [Corynebacterium aquatimens]|uniref:glucose-6-phosphate dehydrogenase assembly protein OpcA n=1 Tax=Corynebacterium aquatimens TaxID=1190508 RepID=UPI003313FA09
MLTLLVAVKARDNVRDILATIRDATREHPARVLVLILGDSDAHTSLDAEIVVGADAGASEMVVMQLHGELTDNLDAVVTPLLLPDTPIVAWWPTTAPARPQRRRWAISRSAASPTRTVTSPATRCCGRRMVTPRAIAT